MRPLRIAIIGGRGIPGGWTGFETFAEELSARLVNLGHQVTVYCRKGYAEEQPGRRYKGVEQVFTPYLENRALERLSHEATSLIDSIRRDIDIYYVLGTPGAPLYVPLRATRRLVVINTDGLDWKRRKWSGAGSVFLRFAEWTAARLAADQLVADAEAMRAYYLKTYGRDSAFISNGAHILTELPEGGLDQWGVEAGRYYLIACRIEPENNVDRIIEEFIASGSDKELVVAGGMNYETPFWRHIHDLAEGHPIRFLGPVYGPMLVERLHLGCYGYLHGHEVGGTNPALLKAMGCGNCALALNTEFNSEVLDGTGLLWEKHPGSLAERIRWADGHPDEVRAIGDKARDRIREAYTWDLVAQQHDALFRSLAGRARFVARMET